jgi:very-short-patch-repair endonuclease
MKKLDTSDIDWNEIQRIHDSGTILVNLGVSRKMLNLAEIQGLFKKNHLHRKWSDEEKIEISKRRKKWLLENPEKHVWKRNDKFKSVPCEQLKDYLRSEGIKFEEEVTVSKEKSYSVDILIPSKFLVIEINGNQHYDKFGNLNKYYQERHDYISSLGWKVIEVHYSFSYNHELILGIINEEPEKSQILYYNPRKNRKDKRLHGVREKYSEFRKKKWEEENLKYVKIIQESDIDFSKFGWVNKAALVIGIKPQKVNLWMKRMMPEFYENGCFKKSNR